MDPELSHWLICDELTILQAVYLHFGDAPVDPDQFQSQKLDYVDDMPVVGWNAIMTAIKGALKSKAIEGELVFYDGMNKQPFTTDAIDPTRSTINVASLKLWLRRKGVHSEFFGITLESIQLPFLDPNHPRYSSKLAASIIAWQSMQDNDLKGVTPKAALVKWLKKNAEHFNLLNPDGSFNTKGIDGCATVANWKTKGGSPKTPN